MAKILSASDIKKIMPKTTFKTQQPIRDKYTEWCISKYIIGGKNYVTISIHSPQCDELVYVDNTGRQIVHVIDSTYDKFLVDKTYWYAS